MAELRLTGIGKRFGAVQAVADLHLDMPSGEFFVLLGPSGAGKTTTLRLVAGLEQPDAGHVYIGGHDVTTLAPALRDVAFVFQQYSLYPHLSVYDNLAFPLRSPLRPMPEAQIRAKVTEVARLLRIEDKLKNAATRCICPPDRRVAIGRALVRDPQLYLMDEPLSSLDAKLRNDLRLELKRIQQDLGATMLYVTHDQIEAMTMASRIGVLEGGRLVQVGTPREIYENPSTSQVATRLGSPRINLFARSLVPAVNAPGEAVTVGVRAEHLRIHRQSANDAHRAARVRRIERLSDLHLVHVAPEGSDQEWIVSAPGGESFAPDDAVRIELLRPLWFDAAGHRVGATPA